MDTRARGVFAIPWHQTEIDGCPGAPPDEIAAGALWRWTGPPLRLDGPPGLLPLPAPREGPGLRRRAGRRAARLPGAAAAAAAVAEGDDPPPPEPGFTVTDGRRAYALRLIAAGGAAPLLAVEGALPPPGTDLWVVRRAGAGGPARPRPAAGGAEAVICFTAGTRIETPRGPCPVEALLPGDRVLTCDDGPQEVLWIGTRTVSSARLRACPALRPVRIRAGALGARRPDGDLLVSPRHRLLLRGRAPAALFGTPEVLVAAADLAGDLAVTVDHSLRPVTYIHLLFARHQILRANGLESESFHPDAADPGVLDAAFPGWLADARRYGPPARRALSAGEAAILLHDLGPARRPGAIA